MLARGCHRGSRNKRMTPPPRHITAEELLKMGDIGRCELIYGELVMMSPASIEHGAIAARFARYVGNHVEANALGEVFVAEAGFKLASDPDLVRTPDVSFVRTARLQERSKTTFFSG